MMPLNRRDIEILLDSPDQRDLVVSAYADMTVQDGFFRYAEWHLDDLARQAEKLLSEADARKALEANIEVIREAIRDHASTPARGLAVFSSVDRGLRDVRVLDFPVENHLVVDREPFIRPLLEQWFGEPSYLIAVVDADEVHLFESHGQSIHPARDLERPDVHQDIERDKPRFTYKKRFAQTHHERLHAAEQDQFLQDVAGLVERHWSTGGFAGIILLGQSQNTAPLRRLLPRDAEQAVVDEAPQAMTTRTTELADDVARAMDRWHAEREGQLLAELRERWKENHKVASGPTDVLDALQQGRVAQVVFGTQRDLPGARCLSCGYRFGAPVETCVYCQSRCRQIDAAQEILRMAMRHRVPVYLFNKRAGSDPIEAAGGVAALLVAEANWAPDAATAAASMGHGAGPG